MSFDQNDGNKNRGDHSQKIMLTILLWKGHETNPRSVPTPLTRDVESRNEDREGCGSSHICTLDSILSIPRS